MKVYHIIEQTTDQQVMEIRANSAQQAIRTYLAHCTHERAEGVVVLTHGRVMWEFPSEYCIMYAQTERLIFAKWKHKKGLY